MRENSRASNSARFANQLAEDGATGLDANQVGAVDDIRDVADDDIAGVEEGFRQFGSSGECRHSFHCKGSENCVKRNGEFM